MALTCTALFENVFFFFSVALLGLFFFYVFFCCAQEFEKFLRGVFGMAVVRGVAFERCHEVVKALADSWENMKSIPARCGIEETFEVRRGGGNAHLGRTHLVLAH